MYLFNNRKIIAEIQGFLVICDSWNLFVLRLLETDTPTKGSVFRKRVKITYTFRVHLLAIFA